MKISTFPNAKFQNLRETQAITGLGRTALYQGAKSGKYPHIRQGTRILFNIPALLEALDAESRQGGGNL